VSALTRIGAGVVGGLYGAGAMTILRLSARRAGLIDKMVPELIEEWLLREPPGGTEAEKARRNVLHQALHLAYGAAWGALAVPVLERPPRKSFLWGAGLGAGLWAIGMIGLLPKHRASGPAGWRATGPAQMVNVLAHLLYGLSVQLAAREVWTKTRTQRPARVG
jgi:hypothetical protein